MDEKLIIAVFVDYDNIEIGVKSTLRREFDVGITLDALRERGDVVAKFAYANWGLQQRATRQMAESAVQMVQRNPSPRGDKNGGDINLALDALEMAFTHSHVNAFAIVSGDSDFNPLVNKLREYGKRVYIIGGRAFTSNILQQNCHEFISYESLIGDTKKPESSPKQSSEKSQRGSSSGSSSTGSGASSGSTSTSGSRSRKKPKTLDIALAMPLITRTLQVLDRRGVTPQLGLLKSTMLQLDSRFTERDYGTSSFSELIDKLAEAGSLKVSGKGGQAIIETGKSAAPEQQAVRPEDALPMLRDVLETHRLDFEEGGVADDLEAWVTEENPDFDLSSFGFRKFAELLNFAQDKRVVRVEPDEEEGLLVYLGEEFYPSLEPEPEPAPERKPTRRRSSRGSAAKRTRKKAAPKD